mgnify:CR=1 FL=1|tara:strand:+ start:328 stop:777 length:450 start_codon:yes stop_codon:yes gene_type:complete
MIGALVPVLGPILGDVVKRVLPGDKDKAQEIERELQMQLMLNSATVEKAAADIILAEAKSEHWVTSCWRPCLMLTITAIVAWNFLVAPLIELGVLLATSNQIPLTIDLPGELWTLLTVGVGGYTVGRSAEKVANNLRKPNANVSDRRNR